MARTARLGLMVMAVCLAGCFTVEGTLEADGSAKLQLTYVPPRNATLSSEPGRLGSEHVKVDSVRAEPNKGAVAQLRVDDVTKLSTAQAFSSVTVTRTREDGEERLRAVLRNPLERKERDNLDKWAREHPEAAGPRIALTLPGPVRDANRGATVMDRRVEWRISLVEYVKEDVIELEARYTVSKDEKAPPGKS
jgi:hypothetical protein